MSENNQITFVGDHDKSAYTANDKANQWYKRNKDYVKILSGIYNVEMSTELVPDFHSTAVLRYDGDIHHECVHVHTTKQTILPTCTVEGSIKTICLDCNEVIETKVLPIVDHNYSYSSNHDATCLKDGTITGTCSYCVKKITVPDPDTALGHNYIYHSDNNATCVADGTETGVCSHCHDSITRPDIGSILDHEYVFTPNNDATCTTDGTETGKCIRGDKEFVRVLPGTALDHHWISNRDGTHKCTTSNGCNVSETCYPNNEGDICQKCGYQTPVVVDFIITTPILNDMEIGKEFSQFIHTNIPENSGVDWDLSAGIVPPGIIFYRTGEFKGTPSRLGEYTFSVKAIYNGQTITKEFTVTVSDYLITVLFNSRDGILDPNFEDKRKIAREHSIGILPTVTFSNGSFIGWSENLTGSKIIDDNFVPWLYPTQAFFAVSSAD